MMKKQQGLTLIEIMIALALGLFIIAATLTVYVNTIKSSSNTIKSARLNHDLGMAMSLMNNDIRRAGYWGGARTDAQTMNNPFTQETVNVPTNGVPVTDIKIFNLASPTTQITNGVGNCILYSYDANSSGSATPTVLTDDVDANELYGFRLNTANANCPANVGVIEMRLTGSTTASCSDGTWQPITDCNTVNVNTLRFSFTTLDYSNGSSPCTSATSATCLNGTSRCFNSTSGVTTDALICSDYAAAASSTSFAQKRIVNIQITGGLIGDDNADVTKTLASTVKVRNNRVFRKP